MHPSTPAPASSRPVLRSTSSKVRGKEEALSGPYVDGGWRGILFANLAIIDAKAAYTFFREGAGAVWDERWIDSGATRSWYLVWCASLGGVGAK